MRVIESKFRSLNLQEEYCEKCDYKDKQLQYCLEQCEVGKELDKLEKAVFKKRLNNKKSQEETWDEKCKEAMCLFEQGLEYPTIAKVVGCHISSLYRELKKRGLFKVP
ncbi:zinc-finger domain-containing protein [Bacillus cereus]|uniref:zinc-finger domain-containing protein n=1 Tax=Bacillus cereus TaxID=1396 RepID=UPI00397F3080